MVIVISGLPGTGKSTLADAIGAHLRIPVVAKDPIEATLRRGGITAAGGSGALAYDIVTSLAEEHVRAGLSVVIDSVATTASIRTQWQDLSERWRVPLVAIECICSDEMSHRRRLATRQRGIPGWPELSWDDVLDVRARYEPWTGDRLVVDAANPAPANLARALTHLATLAVQAPMSEAPVDRAPGGRVLDEQIDLIQHEFDAKRNR